MPWHSSRFPSWGGSVFRASIETVGGLPRTHVCYFSLHAGFQVATDFCDARETDILAPDISVFIDNDIGRNALAFKLVEQCDPLLFGHVEMIAMDVCDHVLPETSGGGGTRHIHEDSLACQFFLHGEDALHGSATRTTPRGPEIHQHGFALEWSHDGLEHFLTLQVC